MSGWFFFLLVFWDRGVNVGELVGGFGGGEKGRCRPGFRVVGELLEGFWRSDPEGREVGEVWMWAIGVVGTRE